MKKRVVSAKTKKKISRSLKKRALLVGGGAALIGGGAYLTHKKLNSRSSTNTDIFSKDSVKGSWDLDNVPKNRQLPGKFNGAQPADLRWSKNFKSDYPGILGGVLGRFRKKGKDTYYAPVKKPFQTKVNENTAVQRPLLGLPAPSSKPKTNNKRRRKKN
jgi:hypothetical protein